MTRNPLRMGRRKPYALPRRPKPVVVEAPKPRLHARAWDRVKQQPHLYVITSLFLLLLITDRINFITFMSLGFFCLLLSDHLYELGREWYQKRKEEKIHANIQKLLGPDRSPRLGYYQRLAKKRSERSP